MNTNFRFRILLTCVMLVLLIVFSQSTRPALAQSGGGYDLTWNVIAGGGTTSSIGGSYSLGGTAGQADAVAMSGGAYALNGGFWVDLFGYHIELPLIMR